MAPNPLIQGFVVILAVTAGPQLMQLLPTTDPLVLLIGLFAFLGAVQHLLGSVLAEATESEQGEASNDQASNASPKNKANNKNTTQASSTSTNTASGRSKGPQTVPELLQEGSVALAQNNYSRAQSLAEKAADIDPESAEAWELLARAQKWQGNRKEAAATVKKAMETYEVKSKGLKELAKELKGKGSPVEDAKNSSKKGDDFIAKRQYDLAAECYNQAMETLNDAGLTLDSEEADRDFILQVERRRAECGQQLQDWGQCRRSATVVLGADPKDKQALLQRAAANEAMENFEKALEDARLLLSLDPKNGAANRLVHSCQQALRSMR
mmetsp:Transcript_93439/g.204520  ORF Transcript_93439/g.204520 Transcript_93439/m.204520 type:complete len:326 (-) Transcript_93439:66-1043(-)